MLVSGSREASNAVLNLEHRFARAVVSRTIARLVLRDVPRSARLCSIPSAAFSVGRSGSIPSSSRRRIGEGRDTRWTISVRESRRTVAGAAGNHHQFRNRQRVALNGSSLMT